MRDGLAADLEKARQELSRLKEAHTAELQNMTARLHAAKTEWDAEKASLVSEAAKLRQIRSHRGQHVPRKVDDSTRQAIAGSRSNARRSCGRISKSQNMKSRS